MTKDEHVKKKIRPSRFQIIAARDLLNRMTQADLAKAAGVNEITLSLFESGHTKPHDSTIAKIQRALEDRGIEFTNGDNPGVQLMRDKAIIPIA